MQRLPAVLIGCLCLCWTAALFGAPWELSQMVGKDRAGNRVFHARPVEEKYRNPWPDEYEREFQARARKIIDAQSELPARGTTYFESEKRFYGYLMAQVLGKQGLEAIGPLQAEDAQAQDWHRHTEGIDYYACFTLKHQLRKYFYFGELLDPAYRRRMFEGARTWTEQDPLGRPHHAFKKSGPGWGPDVKNSWVDVRSTENLFLMRVTSVYLMAEETGNRQTAEKYKRIILNYAKALYRIGLGEWDSENYHGHSIAPLCNLYDFARDPEVKLAAKACLDWLFAAGAVKYYHGGFNGPGSRDYNHAQPFGGSAAQMLWVAFGDAARLPEDWESDEIHLITSAYRPPLAVVNLARKQFDRPVEILSAKPEYSATTSFDLESPPRYYETQYVGHSYLLGTLSCGTPPGFSAVNGFKLLVDDRESGARIVHAVPGGDPQFAGSPVYQEGKVRVENRVAQYRNLAIWLACDGKSPWLWVLPRKTKTSVKQGVTFLEFDRTWVALRPLGTSPIRADAELTRELQEAKRSDFTDHVVLSARGNAERFCGVAVEVGEQQSHGGFDKFQQQVLAAEVDETELADGIARYRAADGKWLGFHWNDNPSDLGSWRNGRRHDWTRHGQYLYRVEGAEQFGGPIYSRRGEGVLYVEAGGEAFACRVDEQGRVTFEQGTPHQVTLHRGK